MRRLHVYAWYERAKMLKTLRSFGYTHYTAGSTFACAPRNIPLDEFNVIAPWFRIILAPRGDGLWIEAATPDHLFRDWRAANPFRKVAQLPLHKEPDTSSRWCGLNHVDRQGVHFNSSRAAVTTT